MKLTDEERARIASTGYLPEMTLTDGQMTLLNSGSGNLDPIKPLAADYLSQVHESQTDREFRELQEAVAAAKQEILKALPFQHILNKTVRWMNQILTWRKPEVYEAYGPPYIYESTSFDRHLEKVRRFGELYGTKGPLPTHLVVRPEQEEVARAIITVAPGQERMQTVLRNWWGGHDRKLHLYRCSSCKESLGSDDLFFMVPATTLYETSFLRALHRVPIHVQVDLTVVK